MATTRMAPSRGRARELAHRTGSDLEVPLFWRQTGNSPTLLLTEVATGVNFEFTSGPRDALDALNHPYAYSRP